MRKTWIKDTGSMDASVAEAALQAIERIIRDAYVLYNTSQNSNSVFLKDSTFQCHVCLTTKRT